jgi:hypothetical protein
MIGNPGEHVGNQIWGSTSLGLAVLRKAARPHVNAAVLTIPEFGVMR